MSNVPSWTKLLSAGLLILGTYTAIILWASDAHSDNMSGMIENRTRIEQLQGGLNRMEGKIDALLLHLMQSGN
jgi:hypothetical protein